MKVRMIRRLMGAVLLLGALLPTTAFGAVVEMRLLYDGAMHDYRAEEVQIEVNGEALTGLDMNPVILNDRTLVPVRAIFEKLGAEVVWNADAQEVYISYDNQLEVLRIDDNTGLIDGLEFSMDVPPKIINERTMIPARAALEAVGCTVGWQADTRTVTVDDQAHASQPEEPTAPSTSTPNTNDTTQSTSGSTTDDTPAPTGTVTASSPITVQSVTVPASAQSRQSFSVNCSGVIEKYNCFLLGDDRIVVDIYNANNGISNATITGTNSTIVSSIRSAQNQTQPERVARVVFDITAGTGYSATLSNDRRSFQISFDANHITNLTMQSQAGADVITITGEQAPAASFQLLGSPDRLVIDIPNATNSLRSSYEGGLNYVQDARVSMYNTTTTRVVLDLDRMISYDSHTSGNALIITIRPSTLEHMSYDQTNQVLTLENPLGLTAASFSHNDDYQNGQYILTLNGNYRDTYGYGTIASGDSLVDRIVVENDSQGRTRLVIEENQILAVEIRQSGSTLQISFLHPKEVYDKILVLDAGHGLNDPGTNGHGMVEKDVNLDILLRTQALFEANSDIKVYVTRDDDSYPTNVSRAQMANETADLFVSIHQNAATSTSANGIEVLYMNHASDTGNGRLTSQIAAQFMQNYMVSATGLSDRGIKIRSDLIVLNQTKVPAILIECGFLSNDTDAAALSQSATRDAIANAIYSAVTDMFNQYNYR